MALSEGDRVKLSVRHHRSIKFDKPIEPHQIEPQIELHLSPVDTGLQQVWEHSVTVSPDIATRSMRDGFGNRVLQLEPNTPLASLDIAAFSTVETTHAVSCGPESAPDPRPYEERWRKFLAPSAGVPDIAEYDSIGTAQDIAMEMDDIEFGHALYLTAKNLHQSYNFDPEAAATAPVSALFESGSGSSQQMAHAMIGLLRRVGIPARFASGYLFDAGKGMKGSDRPHAWVQAWHEGYGWLGIDPANAMLVGWQYVRTAIGRDYFDVLPCSCEAGGTAAIRDEVTVSPA